MTDSCVVFGITRHSEDANLKWWQAARVGVTATQERRARMLPEQPTIIGVVRAQKKPLTAIGDFVRLCICGTPIPTPDFAGA